MRTKTVIYEIFKYEELSDEVQSKIINNQVEDIITNWSYDLLTENLQRAVDKANDMQTPWFAGSYMLEYAKDDLIDIAKTVEYYSDGTVATV